jgi:ribosomal protein S20
MRSPAKYAAWLLPLFLAGCFHLPFHKRPVQVQTLAPPAEPSQPIELTSIELASIELPPSEMLIPGKPLYNMRERSEPINRPVKHWRRPNPEEAASPAEAVGSPNPAVSAIGVFSSGDPADYRRQTEGSIAAIERGLTSINRTLSDSDQKTADQIREFLKQARAALASGDLDGARTLAAKAKALLDVLTQ